MTGQWWLSPILISHCQHLLDAHQRRTGRELLPCARLSKHQQAQALYAAPFAVVSHGIQADPIFNYANQTALDLWKMSAEQFLQLPSRLSAEAPLREERAVLLARVARQGYIDDYSGIRIARDGSRFRIQQATVWNIDDCLGTLLGQAATFSHWQSL